jgi:hypothetical protein
MPLRVSFPYQLSSQGMMDGIHRIPWSLIENKLFKAREIVKSSIFIALSRHYISAQAPPFDRSAGYDIRKYYRIVS